MKALEQPFHKLLGKSFRCVVTLMECTIRKDDIIEIDDDGDIVLHRLDRSGSHGQNKHSGVYCMRQRGVEAEFYVKHEETFVDNDADIQPRFSNRWNRATVQNRHMIIARKWKNKTKRRRLTYRDMVIEERRDLMYI